MFYFVVLIECNHLPAVAAFSLVCYRRQYIALRYVYQPSRRVESLLRSPLLQYMGARIVLRLTMN